MEMIAESERTRGSRLVTPLRASFIAVVSLSGMVLLALWHFGLPGLAPEKVGGEPSVGTVAFRDADDQRLVLDQPGKLYLIDFMAVGCKPCMKELPKLVSLSQEFEGSNQFQLITVVYAWRGKALRAIAEDLKVGSLPLYADAENVGERLGVTGWPTKFLIRDGRVLYRKLGSAWGDHARWRRIIVQELESAGRRPTRVST